MLRYSSGNGSKDFFIKPSVGGAVGCRWRGRFGSTASFGFPVQVGEGTVKLGGYVYALALCSPSSSLTNIQTRGRRDGPKVVWTEQVDGRAFVDYKSTMRKVLL